MSTLKAANIQSTTTGAPTFKTSAGTEIGQLCKAWVNFNGDNTVAIRDDFNVDSITDEAAGEYSVVFTNAMSNANYCVTGGASETVSGAGYRWLGVGSGIDGNFSKTTTSVSVNPAADSSTKQDAPHVYVIIFGN